MSLSLLLDSGPLGLLTHPQRSEDVVAISDWLSRCLLNGTRIIVPAIVYYELKRELLRARKPVGVARLDAFVNATPGRYPPLSGEALRLAAELWEVHDRRAAPRPSPVRSTSMSSLPRRLCCSEPPAQSL